MQMLADAICVMNVLGYSLEDIIYAIQHTNFDKSKNTFVETSDMVSGFIKVITNRNNKNWKS